MIQLPDTPLSPLSIQQPNEIEPWVQEIINKRLSLSFSSSNYSTFINNLEDYLNFIYSQVSNQDDVNNYLDVFEKSSSFFISNSIPWNLPITNIKKQSGPWSLKDEITIVLINLSITYNLRSGEIVETILNQDSNNQSQQLWLNSFKLFKKSLEFINFLKEQSNFNNDIWETSSIFINFIESLVTSSIQLSFLTKTIWTLKNIEYDIMANDSINYSTLSRLSIFIKDQLKNMLSILKTVPNGTEKWSNYIENLTRYMNGYLGVLLSIENYKQDKIGYSIGFLNFAIENIARKLNNTEFDDDEFDSKLKKKFTAFKSKVKTDKFKLNKTKIKLNQNLIESFTNSTILSIDLKNLFELLQLLNLKYNLENNNLKFDTIPNSQDLLNGFLPSGRSIPIDAKAWAPSFIQSQSQQKSGGYY